jgi:hypothetical protein
MGDNCMTSKITPFEPARCTSPRAIFDGNGRVGSQPTWRYKVINPTVNFTMTYSQDSCIITSSLQLVPAQQPQTGVEARKFITYFNWHAKIISAVVWLSVIQL